MNLFCFAGNGPIESTDPLGLQLQDLPSPFPKNPLTGNGPTTTSRQPKHLQGAAPKFAKPALPDLEYFSDFGWVDWNHANTDEPAKVINAVNREKNDPPVANYVPKGYFRINVGLGHFPSGVSRTYFVQCGLDEHAKVRVAFSVFLDLVKEHETFQMAASRLSGSTSGFSVEDFPSNVLGFYMALNKWDRASVAPMLGKKLDPSKAEELKKFVGGLGGTKNYSPEPVNMNLYVNQLYDSSWPLKMKWSGRVGQYIKPIEPKSGGPWFKP